MYESFSRLSQAIVDAAEVANKDEARKAAAIVVSNSIGVQSRPKRNERSTAFPEAVDTLGDAIQAARGAKLDAEKPEAAKSLAELLAESAQDSE